MNGRVFDPVLGRFLSADSYVQDAGDSQSYNRYSYVSNNPLAYTDPSGNLKVWKEVLGPIVEAVVAYYFGPYAAAAVGATINGWKGAAQGFVAAEGGIYTEGAGYGWQVGYAASSGFSGSLLNGGSIGDAFKAGVIGGAQAYLAGKIGDQFGDVGDHGFWGEVGRAAEHGALGGAIEEAQGGQFRHGFYAGAVGSLASSAVGSTALGRIDGPEGMALRTSIAAVAGGTASVLGGGKFANGAITAAFQHLFNFEAHRGNWFERAGASTKRFLFGDDDGGLWGTSLTATELFSDAGNGAMRGAAAYADGFIPVWDPFESMGVYNHLDDGLYWSQAAGMIGFEAVATVSGTRVLAAVGNTRWGSVLNANRYLRFGDGRVGGNMIPRISIGNGKPSFWNHWWW
jgi:hypothetical protein